jgi:integrase
MAPEAQQHPAVASTTRAPQGTTLAELVDAYMSAYTGRDRSRIPHLARWLELLGAERPFAEISDDDVFHAMEVLRREPARLFHGRDAHGAPLPAAKAGRRSEATVNRYHASLSAVFTWAVKKRRAPRGWENPCRKVERAPEAPGIVRFLADDELERLLASAKASSWPRLYLLILMAITTGARRGELLGLTWGDVDLERAVAHIRRTKNGQARALPLVPAVLEELRRFAGAVPQACVFPSRGELDKPRAFESAWRAALDRARVRRFRFHDLRHTCASYLAQNGASLLEISDTLGHRQLAMTKRYSHLTVDSKAKLVNRVLGGIR